MVLVGIGVHERPGIPYSALSDIRRCGKILLDSYTSPLASNVVRELERVLGRGVKLARRSLLEDPVRVVRLAEREGLAILVPGDVFVATTHEVLRQEAVRRGLEVRVWFSSSIINAALGVLGLHTYKLGFIGTVVRGGPAVVNRVYMGVNRALLNGQHSVILLEYDAERGYYMKPSEALSILLDAEANWRTQTFSEDRVVVIASRVGWSTQRVEVARVVDVVGKDHGDPPHVVVVPGKLHYTEKESLQLLFKADQALLEKAGDLPSPLLKRLAVNAIRKTRSALPRFSEALRKLGKKPGLDFNRLLENVDSYVNDAEKFINEGNYEMALAEAGYAEGLLDSLRLLGLVGVEW